MTFAHVAGMPVEESLLTLAPVLPLLALALRARVARLVARGIDGRADGAEQIQSRISAGGELIEPHVALAPVGVQVLARARVELARAVES